MEQLIANMQKELRRKGSLSYEASMKIIIVTEVEGQEGQTH